MHLLLRQNPRQLNSVLRSFLTSAPVVIFAVAFLLRLAVAAWLPERAVWPDGKRYESVALSLLEGQGFGSIEANRRSVPTQPMLIAAVWWMFGKSYFALRAFFAALGAASCVIGYAISKQLFSKNAAVVTGFLLAVYPYYIYLSALFEYPQTFFIFVMSVFFLLFYRYLELQQEAVLFLSGISLGIAVLSVPTVLIFVPLVLLHLLSKSFTVSIKRLSIVVVAIVIPLGAWSARNYIAYDHFILVNSASGTNLWVANNETYYRYGKEAVTPECAPGYEDTQYCRANNALREQLRDRGLSSVPRVLEIEAASWKNGIEFFLNFPTEAAILMGRKFLEFWSPVPNAVHKEEEHGGAIRDLISIVSYTPILALGLLGMFLSKHEWRRHTLIYAYFVAFTAPYTIFLPTTRYRLPLDFFLIMFTAVVLIRWWERKGRSLLGHV